jgi:hypothetical protein
MKIPKPKKKQVLFMILQGRLGNQLFIFFAAKYFEEKYNKKVVFISDSKDRLHQVGIKSNNFNVILPKYLFKIFNMILRKLSLLKITSEYIHFCKNIGFEDLGHKLDRLKFLNGHFQTNYYIEKSSISDLILNDIKLYLNSNFFIDSNYTFESAIAIHIRRGDYLLEKNNYFGVLSDDYYMKSLNSIFRLIEYDKIYLFSDSRISCEFKGKITSSFKNLEIIDINELDIDDIWTLAILIRFSSYIISNSTYSWWGAYLGNRIKIVIAPSIWFKNHQDPEKLYPLKWETVESAWD